MYISTYKGNRYVCPDFETQFAVLCLGLNVAAGTKDMPNEVIQVTCSIHGQTWMCALYVSTCPLILFLKFC
jgi:hypothetical protein